MYEVVIQIHRYLSWLLLGAAAFALFRAWSGLIFRKYWSSADKLAGNLFTGLIDLQLVAGIILYAGLSPVTTAVFSNFREGIREPELRFYAIDHILVMVFAFILIHTGRSLARKAQFASRKHRISAVWFTLATALILFRIPWERIFAM